MRGGCGSHRSSFFGQLQNFDSIDGIALKRTRWRWMFDLQLAEVCCLATFERRGQ
jgi:hypothetical protein